MNMKLENNRFLKITELFAFITQDKDGDGSEGIMAFLSPDKTWMPMVGADLERVESLMPIADEMCKLYGMQYEIRYFVQKT